MFNYLDLSSHQLVLDHSDSGHWGIDPVQEPFSFGHDLPLLPSNLHELAQSLQDVVVFHRGTPRHLVGVDYPLRMKYARTIYLFKLVWTLTLMGPGWPLGSHCLDHCFVSGVWNNTADSFIVTILSYIARGRRWTTAKNYLTCPHPLLFLLRIQKPRHPPR
jgi:hypothetical protein